MKAKALAIFGTQTGVGKSFIATGFCRMFKKLGLTVAPFKAQNMSNNSYVVKGGEMGRAQVEQAWAAGATPHVDMNPILLKPLSNTTSQVIVSGKVFQTQNDASSYFTSAFLKKLYDEAAEPALHRLMNQNDVVVIEGAGSCAEINLWDKDIVNWRIAQSANAKVILVADIDRCGVFAQLIGTYSLLPEEYKQLVCGFIINKFRGDRKLITDLISFIERKTSLPVLGVLPMDRDLYLDSEDGLRHDSIIDPPAQKSSSSLSSFDHDDKIKVAVILLPFASNLTDFHALEREPSVLLHYLYHPRPLSSYDLILLPGSKNTIHDLRWLKGIASRDDRCDDSHLSHSFKSGVPWSSIIQSLAATSTASSSKSSSSSEEESSSSPNSREEGEVMIGGICGGFQMLGDKIADPLSIEFGGEEEGLNILTVSTSLHAEKTLKSVKAMSSFSSLHFEPLPIDGYQIHCGVTSIASSDHSSKSADRTIPLLLSSSEIELSSSPISSDHDRSDSGDVEQNVSEPETLLKAMNLPNCDSRFVSPESLLHSDSFNKDDVVGAQRADGRVWGCYLHGLFDNAIFRHKFLSSIRPEAVKKYGVYSNQPYADWKESQYDMLAQLVADHVDISTLKSSLSISDTTK